MSRRPLKRLLLVPALMLVALVAALQLLDAVAPRVLDPELAVDVPETQVQDAARRCARDGDERTVADVRASLGADPIVTSAMVMACPMAFDGRTVRYAGEAVGDLLHRDGGAWVLVNDDDYALEVGPLPSHGEHRGTNAGLTVWLPERFHGAITGLGRPDRRGDVLAIEGRIVRADPQDGGGLTLRASSVEVLASSVHVTQPFDVPQLWFALSMTVLAVGVWVLRRRAARP